ncbi:MAG: PEGA domain-containing protein [Actinomycetota bacterium]|nr:PEGA domain-containing protein [Actinomycetota bacterium]
MSDYEYRRREPAPRSRSSRMRKVAPPERATRVSKVESHTSGIFSQPGGGGWGGGNLHTRSHKGRHRETAIFTGSSRRNTATIGFVALVIGVLALTIGVTAWILTRPASVAIAATPSDASIVFNGSQSASGTLTAGDLKPGRYTVAVTRKGFGPVSVSVELKRGKKTKLTYSLKPMPFAVSVTTHPKGATCTLTTAAGTALTGAAPFEQQATAGKCTLTVVMAGYNTIKREVFLDEPLSFNFYLDPEGQVLRGLGTITTKGAPKGVSVTPDGSEAWTSILNGPPSIEIFEPRSGKKIGEVDIGKYGAVEVIFNKAGTLAYTSQMETAECFEIDVKTRKVLREFKSGSAWTKWVQLSPDEKTLYASNWSGDDVSIIDLTTGELTKRIGVSNTPRGMYATADGKTLYVAGFDSGFLDKIDLASGTVTTVYKSGGALRHLVADEKTGRLFISDMSKDKIYVHDMKTGITKTFVDVDEKPNTIDLALDGKVLFVSCRGENNPKSYYVPGPEWGSILVFDAATAKPLDAVIGGNQCTALDVSDDGTILIFSDFLDNRLRVYEVPSYETLVKGNGGRYQAHFAQIKK